jgi:hypothetical protein
MPDPNLIRFLDAQAPIYSRVVEELTKGRKRTHWMWFIFPQIAGQQASDAFSLDFNFMKAVSKIESDFDPEERTGSYFGLFQLSKGEFAEYGVWRHPRCSR